MQGPDPTVSRPLISCLTITREARFHQLARAVECFHRQTVGEKELVVVHDESEAFDQELRRLAGAYPDDEISIHRAQRGLPLGALRNLSLSFARGGLVCQWDDDDLYHPERLEMQLRTLEEKGADFCFLTDQLHYFEPTGELFWDDWQVEGYPGSLIQGTMLGCADRIDRYQALARGEDTDLLQRLLGNGCRLAGISGHGYLYIYVYDGRNAWDIRHHAAQSVWKRLRRDALLQREEELRKQLQEYDLPWKRVVMPFEGGELKII